MKQELFNYILSGVRVNKVWPLVLSGKTMEDWMQELCRLYIPRNARSSRIPESSSINRAQKRCCIKVHFTTTPQSIQSSSGLLSQNVEMAQLALDAVVTELKNAKNKKLPDFDNGWYPTLW
jgi:hypothetical protein